MVAILLVSCIADFDRHRVDFTEGPLVFRLDADGIEVPEGVLVGGSGECTVADLDCTGTECPTELAVCDETGVCLYRSTALLYQDVDMDHAYGEELLRVDSVRLEELVAVVRAFSLNVDLGDVTILWAPEAATRREAREIAHVSSLDPMPAIGVLDSSLTTDGLSGLETYLETSPRFQLFVEFETFLEPGSPCPEGELEMELSLHFLLTGEPRG